MSKFGSADAEQILQENFAPWVLELQPSVTRVEDNGIDLKIPFNEKLCRIGGIICGQALISAADTAMVVALAAQAGGMRPMTTVDLTSNYMRPIVKGDVSIRARVVRCGKSLAFCTCEIVAADSGKIAAFATGTYAMLD